MAPSPNHEPDSLKLGIIGMPLSHTLSPRLHAYLLKAMNISGDYSPHELPANAFDTDDLPLKTFSNEGFRGLNVTIPHKVSIIPHLDWISPEVKALGAANTLVFETAPGKPGHCVKKGYNTDMQGFMTSLPSHITSRLPHSDLLLLGGGGSARAVVASLLQLGTARITVAIRNPRKAAAFLTDVKAMRSMFPGPTKFQMASLDNLPPLTQFHGIINATPLGMWPQDNASPLSHGQMQALHPKAFLYDLIYRPLQTQLLRDATELGLTTLNGLDMLIYQGVASLEHWQPRRVPVNLIPGLRTHLQEHLQSSHASKP